MTKMLPIVDQPTAAETATAETAPVDADEVRRQLAEESGPAYWRSLEELSSTRGFRDLLHRELPRFAAEWEAGLDRRRFLQLSSASMALAGLAACTKQPPEKVVPYVRQPEEIVPGKPLYYATAATLGGYVTGVLAESHMGRPTKLEGNPEHPASLGGADIFAQASILALYDPDRSRAVQHLDEIVTWGSFVDQISAGLLARRAVGGQGLAILHGPTSSPTFARLADELRQELPAVRWYGWEPTGRSTALEAAATAFGSPAETHYDLSQADVVLAVDSDFLSLGPAAVRYAKDFARRRKVDSDAALELGMNRLYSVDSSPNTTSASADHRLALKPAEVGHFLVALASRLGAVSTAMPASFASGKRAEWLEAVAGDLEAHRGTSLVTVGDQADAELHVLVHAINSRLGNLGTTVLLTDPVLIKAADGSLAELVADIDAGEIDLLVILGANPVYSAPADLDLVAALAKVEQRVHLGHYADETAEHCHWHIPQAHYLETWTDGRAFDGTASVGQPIIEPMFAGKTPEEMLALLLGRSTEPVDELVRETWRGLWSGGGSFDSYWQRLLHDGLDPATASQPRSVVAVAGASEAAATLAGRSAEGLELQFRLDPTILDGSLANNGWLQECPKPLTKLTWDNALLMAPATARRLGLGDLVEGNDQRATAPLVQLSVGDRSLELPVWVLPGQAEDTLTVHLGGGRWRGGSVAEGVGFYVNPLRTSAAAWNIGSGVEVKPTGGTYLLASTQDHHSMEGRNLVRGGTLAGYKEFLDHEGDAADHGKDHGDGHGGGDDGHGGYGGHKAQYPPVHHHGPIDISLMDGKDFPYDGYAWGMTIDLSACTGCNACLVACQSENNIPVVGKDQVGRGREMHWIRVDRYFGGESADQVDEIFHQPVPCMQCEEAPCEVVCPVAATVHSDEGLNDMVYNRCVGTRYCSNNCPYKVRRFNFLLYQDFKTPELQLRRNPDVTVRSRGVMEKCTYCVQRINQARIESKVEGRKIRDGEITTACQQACPSEAIAFGDVNDSHSEVSHRKATALNYSVLEELGTRPRTTYLARIRNPNPVLAGVADAHGANSGHGGAGHLDADPADEAHGAP